MNTKDLMLGDWVESRGKIEQVREVYEGYICTDSFEDSHDYYFDPIPLTPEILEKNGFTMNTKAKSKKAWQISDNELYVSWWNGRLNTYYKPEVTKSMNHINTDCVYVHELQHALRLCGIDKEIVL